MEQLGKRIAFLRKQANLTQEALGKAVGVSAQAVSKWENGGAPDVELLPTVADALGVTMDGLFGLQEGKTPDMEKLLFQYIGTAPMAQRMERLCRLVWAGIQGIVPEGIQGESLDYVEKSSSGGVPIFTALSDDNGFILGCPSRELHYFFLYPEPEKGYGAFLGELEQVRDMLGCLSRPGRLELLLWLHREKPEGYIFTARSAAKGCGISEQAAKDGLEDLADRHLLLRMVLSDGEDQLSVYQSTRHTGLLPFLMMCQWMEVEERNYFIGYEARKKPWLKQEEEITP